MCTKKLTTELLLLVLPCPFCGKQPECQDYDYLGFFVSCENPDCGVNPSSNGGEDDSLEAAIKNWNNRA